MYKLKMNWGKYMGQFELKIYKKHKICGITFWDLNECIRGNEYLVKMCAANAIKLYPDIVLTGEWLV